MQLRKITPKDYPLMCEWWKSRNFPPVPPGALSQSGLIIEPYCFGFIFRTDSQIAWLEWTCSNPNSDSTERNTAMNTLIDALIKEAKDMGFKFLFTSSSDTKLIDRLSKHGFGVTDSQVTHLLKEL